MILAVLGSFEQYRWPEEKAYKKPGEAGNPSQSLMVRGLSRLGYSATDIGLCWVDPVGEGRVPSDQTEEECLNMWLIPCERINQSMGWYLIGFGEWVGRACIALMHRLQEYKNSSATLGNSLTVHKFKSIYYMTWQSHVQVLAHKKGRCVLRTCVGLDRETLFTVTRS